MHELANPLIFQRIYRILNPLLLVAGLIIFSAAMFMVFTRFQPDYLQGHTVAILYIHVPAAWLTSAFYMVMAISSAGFLIWRHPLAMLSIKAAAPIGLCFALITLITGMFWAKPTWGAWWVWDPRLISVLILLWIYIVISVLIRICEVQQNNGQIVALFVIVGTLILPIIHFSVIFWNSIHQGQSISFTGDSKIDTIMLVPLWLSIIGISLISMALHLYGMRTGILQKKHQRLMQVLYKHQT